MLRETIASTTWIPESVKPVAPPKPVIVVVPVSKMRQVQDWLASHKILIGAVVVLCGTAAYKAYRRNESIKKVRRAKRAKNGGRTEVIVIAGSPRLPLTKSLSLDMERRGFIVFLVCNAAEDVAAVQALARPDILPLSIDTTNVSFDFQLLV